MTSPHKGCCDHSGQPHPAVAEMVGTLGRADRTLEGRWWRRDVGGVMVRFAVCRKGEHHVVAARDGELLVLQLVAPQVGLAGMVTTVLGPAPAADVEPLTGVATELATCTTAAQLVGQGVAPASARIYAEIVANPSSWVEITRHPTPSRRHVDADRGRRRRSRLSAGQAGVAAPPRRRRAVRKLSVRHPGESAAHPGRITGVPPRGRLVRSHFRRRFRLLP